MTLECKLGSEGQQLQGNVVSLGEWDEKKVLGVGNFGVIATAGHNVSWEENRGML